MRSCCFPCSPSPPVQDNLVKPSASELHSHPTKCPPLPPATPAPVSSLGLHLRSPATQDIVVMHICRAHLSLDYVASPSPLLPVSSQAHLFLFDQGCPLPVAATQCDCPLGMLVAGSAWVWVEGGRDMHRRTVPHGLLTSELAGIRDGFRREELPVCPKPRRPAAPLPEFLTPLSCKHSHPSYEGGSKVLDKIPSKKNDGQESVSIGCPPSCYCGSPPSRVRNPLVHDVEFIHQMEHLSLLQKRKLSDKSSSFPSAS